MPNNRNGKSPLGTLAGIFVAGTIITSLWYASHTKAPDPGSTAAIGEARAETASEPKPFVATVDNEKLWRPEALPVDWPAFSRLPDEKPLPAKPTKAKIDGAQAIIARWDAFNAGKTKDFPTQKETDPALRYLLSIPRSDAAFPEAWAAFIKLRQVDGAISREIARQSTVLMLQKQEVERKRTAKTRGVNVGMTQKEVTDSNWGKPKSVNTTITAYGKREQWVYGGSNYLYFENGVLTSIQTGQ